MFQSFYLKEFHLKINSSFLLILLTLSCFNYSAFGSTYEISGIAKGSGNKYITALSYEEYFTLSQVVEKSILINEDGSFKLEVEAEENDLIVLRIGTVNAQFYLGESLSYHILFDTSKAQLPLKFTNTNWCSVSFIDLPKADLNTRLEVLNKVHSDFYKENNPEIYQILSSPNSVVKERIKGGKKKVDLVKSEDSDDVFILENDLAESLLLKFNDKLLEKNIDPTEDNFVSISARYMMAELESLLGKNEKEVREKYCEGELYLKNLEFISFYKSHYRNVFDEIYQSDVRNLFLKRLYDLDLDSAIIELSPVFENLGSQNIEFTMLAGIENGLNLPNIPARDITLVLEMLIREGSPEIKVLASNYRRELSRGKKGYEPENFMLFDLDNNAHELVNWKGQFVYISTFSTWNTESTGHQENIKRLEQKYGNRIKFVSICMDEEWTNFQDFLIENRNYNWLFLFGNGDKLLKEKLALATVPQYLLLDPDGKILIDHTPSPEEGVGELLDRILRN